MFENINKSIKVIAIIWMIIGIIASLIVGGIILDSSAWGLLIWLIGIGGSITSAIFMYGFGELIENTQILIEHIRQKSTTEINNDSDIQEKLNTLATLKDAGLITEEEYIEKYRSITKTDE